MIRTYGKYGWEIILSNPDGSDGNPWASLLASLFPSAFPESSSSAAPQPAATSALASSGSSGSNSSSSGSASNSSKPSATATSTSGNSTASSASGEIGAVSAVPETDDSEYLETVKIGTSPQTMNMDFDTGSSDLWVFSTSLSSSESSGHTLFDPAKSSTFQDYQGGTFSIEYGDGSSASGTVGFDKVNIGGATATRQAVEIATQVSGSFIQDTKSDGLVGLAFSSINTVQPQQQNTFFENVRDQLKSFVFTANLEDGSGGSYTFGEIDSSQYTGEIHYTDVDNSNGFWQFTSDSYSIGGNTSKCTTCSPAIADTGTSLLLVDEDIVQAYYAKVTSAQVSQTQGGYVYDCSETLPNFAVAVGSYMASIDGSKLTYAQVGGGQCFGGIQSNSGENIQIYGDMFLKNFLAVFDGENTQFGVANKA